MDFSQDELFDVIDRLLAGMLERAGVDQPPVDALRIAEEHFGIPVDVVEPVEEDEFGRRRARARSAGSGIVLSPDMTEEQRQQTAANGIARTLIPDVLRKLDVKPGTENKQFVSRVVGILVSRILVPTRLLRTALRDCKNDLLALKSVFVTAAVETIALRWLDLDQPCIVSILDDGVVAVRRGNRNSPGKKLEAPEQECHDKVMQLDLPHRLRSEGWTVQGWPIPNCRFRRIILRSVPDDV